MATCKQCGQIIKWPEPYKQGQRPFEPDGATLHDCPAYKKRSMQEEAQDFVDEEARKRETNKKPAPQSIREAAIQIMHDEKQEVSEGFLRSKQEYNKLYASFVQVYLRDVALKEKAIKLEARKEGVDYATL